MPHPLTQRIDLLRRRQQRGRWLAAVGWVGATFIGFALALMLTDYLLRPADPGLRWLAAFAIDLTLVLAIRHWVLPVWRSPETTAGIAQRVQERYPQLGSRLASALEFVQQPTEDPQAGSADLRRAVVVETANDIEGLAIEEVVDPRPMRRAGWAVGAVLLAAVVFVAADSTGFQIAATRLAAPWKDLDWPRRHQLVITDAPERLARGQTFAAVVADENGTLPDDLRVLYRTNTAGATRTDEQPVLIAGETAVAERENVQRSFAYRVVGGDDTTMPWTEVQVVDPPSAKVTRITATPPTYSGLPVAQLTSDIRVLSGTRLLLEAISEATLESATLELTLGEQTQSIAASVQPITDDTSESAGSTITIPASAWQASVDGKAAQSGNYRLRLMTADGLFGETSPRAVRYEPDPAPAVDWQAPTTDLFVTSQATVPIAAAAADNLAIRSIELVARPGNQDEAPTQPAGEESNPPSPAETKVPLYAGPAEPPARPEGLEFAGEQIGASIEWSLESLDLKEGDQLLLTLQASDYRPGVGATAVSRRVTIISTAELDLRIADAAAALARNLERSLTQQRTAREQTERLTIEARNGQSPSRATTDQLTTLGYEQREIAAAVADPRRGAQQQALELLAEIRNNNLDRPELTRELQDIADKLADVANKPLPDAERALADARRAATRGVESPQASAEAREAPDEMSQSLAQAGESQDEAIVSLESLVDSLGRWSDLQRFTREAADLERRQRELASDARRQAAEAANDRRSESEQRTDREKLAAAQTELGRRFDRLQQTMRDELQQASEPTPATQPIADALAESEDRATGGKISDAARQLAQGQLGRAAEQQTSAADDLQQMLDILRDRASSDPKQLAEQLRDAQQRLSELRQQAATESQSSPDAERREQLAQRTERLARRLDRLDAPQASDSTQQGGEQMSQSSSQSQTNPLRSQQSMEQAEEQLEQAEQQLAQRLDELEDEIAQSVLEKLAGEIDGYVDRQRQVLDGTVLAFDAGRQRPANATGLLAQAQRALEVVIAAAAEELASRAVFSLALESAAADMRGAAERLEADDPSRPTQRREYAALTRLRHVSQVLKPSPNLTPPDSEQGGQGSQGGQGKQPEPPPIAVAELKMLRLMQLDVNARTRQFEADAASGLLARSERQEQARTLAAEQQQLLELVRELSARNNEPAADVPLETN
ncbi:MAG: hypothetical protein AAGF31_02855 [Planctomycetota bacterium]